MTTKSTFARNFKFFREKARIGQEALAEKIGVNVRTISVYETGKGYPKVDLLVKISRVLQIPVEYFFAEDPERAGEQNVLEAGHVNGDSAKVNKVKEYRNLLSACRQLVMNGDRDACQKLLDSCSDLVDDLEAVHHENTQLEAKLKFATDLIRSIAGGKQLF